ncbi:MAG: prepilin-type N-terminal cleavage/methylation domain-containing protein [Deltaproteobacteria bacterium]|nr:prepilin-type N-terminal cleavage/methylation domain-containing protein [Deltaproteobacteria bacterium]
MFSKIRDTKGFTLIELAIVLVIIGIIIGAVMKGRDVIRNSQIKEFEQSFAGKWITIADGFFDKTGINVTDGAAATYGGTTTTHDGFMDGGANGYYNLANTTGRQNLFLALRRAGIDPCLTVKANLFDAPAGNDQCTDGKNVMQTKIDGEFLSRKTVTMGFSNWQILLAGQLQRKNFLFFTGVPLDVAIAIDKFHDGVEGGAEGTFLNFGCAKATDPANEEAIPGIAAGAQQTNLAAWPAVTAGNNDQVCIVGYMLEH